MALMKVGLTIQMSHDAQAATKTLGNAHYPLLMMMPLLKPFRAIDICGKESRTAIGDAAHAAWAEI